jgi:hypothetical protein
MKKAVLCARVSSDAHAKIEDLLFKIQTAWDNEYFGGMII